MKVLLKENDNWTSTVYLKYWDTLDRNNKYDAIIHAPDLTEEILKENKRILLIEKTACSDILTNTRIALKHPHVITLAKMYFNPRLENNNEPAVGGRNFCKYINPENVPQESRIQLTQEEMDKVVPGFSHFHCKKIEQIGEIDKVPPISERKIDLFFAGTTQYSLVKENSKLITAHRKKCLENMNKLKEQGLVVECFPDRAYNHSRYIKTLLNTKVVLSPFGLGERCWRDIEGMMCGCIVVKPYSDPTVEIPNIYDFIDVITKEFDSIGKDNIQQWIEESQKSTWLFDRIEALNEMKRNEHKVLEDILK